MNTEIVKETLSQLASVLQELGNAVIKVSTDDRTFMDMYGLAAPSIRSSRFS